ncbi:MAG: electron transport complex subunit RsxC [Bacteroidia bacterium]|nr:electron transport complex subunit RsxC [Bacteroidia bacterium]
MSLIKRRRFHIQPQYNKSLTANKAVEEATVPDVLYFYLSTHVGKPAKPVVAQGDNVKIGTLIAKAEGEVSSNVHSSVSGEVLSIENKDYFGKDSKCIVIKNNHLDEAEAPLYDINTSPDADETVRIIREAGISGMGGAMFPTDVKLSGDEETPIETLIVNGAECEPYANSDYRLMIENSEEIAEGIKIVTNIFPLKHIFVAIEDDARACITAMQKSTDGISGARVVALKTAYPQGAEQVLIKQITGKEIPSGSQPPAIGTLVMNVGTLFSIYQAVALGKPVTERVVTVSGKKLKNPRNLRTRLGTPVDSLLHDCGGVDETPRAVLHGGPMMGKAITSGDISVSAGTTAITVLFGEDNKTDEMACIRCSECLFVCPVKLQPVLIHNARLLKNYDKANDLGALDCIQCGNCTYICPSKIDLLASIRTAVSAINEQEK